MISIQLFVLCSFLCSLIGAVDQILQITRLIGSQNLLHPKGVSLDTVGNLYVADTDNNRVCVIRTAGGNAPCSTIVGNGFLGFGGDGGPALSAQLNQPSSVTVDTSGNVYISDTNNHRIRMASTNNIASRSSSVTGTVYTITTIAGTTRGFGGDGAAATLALLNTPFGVTLDTEGNVYIADQLNHRIRLVTVRTGFISTIAGTGNPGSSGDNGAPTSAQLSSPRGISLAPNKDLYIADYGNDVIRKISAGTNIITSFAGVSLQSPCGVAVGSNGNMVYIADSGSAMVRFVTGANSINTGATLNTFAGTGVIGSSGDNGAASLAQLNYPQGIVVDVANNVYIADTSNNAIRQVSLATPQAAIPPITTPSSFDLRYLALLAVIVPIVGLVVYFLLCHKQDRRGAPARPSIPRSHLRGQLGRVPLPTTPTRVGLAPAQRQGPSPGSAQRPGRGGEYFDPPYDLEYYIEPHRLQETNNSNYENSDPDNPSNNNHNNNNDVDNNHLTRTESYVSWDGTYSGAYPHTNKQQTFAQDNPEWSAQLSRIRAREGATTGATPSPSNNTHNQRNNYDNHPDRSWILPRRNSDEDDEEENGGVVYVDENDDEMAYDDDDEEDDDEHAHLAYEDHEEQGIRRGNAPGQGLGPGLGQGLGQGLDTIPQPTSSAVKKPVLVNGKIITPSTPNRNSIGNNNNNSSNNKNSNNNNNNNNNSLTPRRTPRMILSLDDDDDTSSININTTHLPPSYHVRQRNNPHTSHPPPASPSPPPPVAVAEAIPIYDIVPTIVASIAATGEFFTPRYVATEQALPRINPNHNPNLNNRTSTNTRDSPNTRTSPNNRPNPNTRPSPGPRASSGINANTSAYPRTTPDHRPSPVPLQRSPSNVNPYPQRMGSFSNNLSVPSPSNMQRPSQIRSQRATQGHSQGSSQGSFNVQTPSQRPSQRRHLPPPLPPPGGLAGGGQPASGGYPPPPAEDLPPGSSSDVHSMFRALW